VSEKHYAIVIAMEIRLINKKERTMTKKKAQGATPRKTPTQTMDVAGAKSDGKARKIIGIPMTWVRVSDMVINDLCQQPLKRGFAQHLADNLDLFLLGHLTVNILTSGKAEVLDGQTRMWALKHCGYHGSSLYCDTFYDLSDSEKALKFVALNNKKNPSVFHKFVKAVTGKQPREVAINAIVEKHGCHVSESADGNSIVATAALGRVFDKYGATALHKTIATLHMSYPDDRHGLDGLLIESVGMIYGRYNGSIDDARLIEVMATERRGYVTFYQSAELERSMNNGTKLNCLASVITQAYNKSFGKIKVGRLPKWWSQPNATVDAGA
jgi:hypothetical protein